MTAFEFVDTFIIMLQDKKLFYASVGLISFIATVLLFLFIPELKNIFFKPSLNSQLSAKSHMVKASTRHKTIGTTNHVTLTLRYTNQTDKDITDLHVWLSVPGQTRYGFAETSSAKFNLPESKAHKGYLVYNIPTASASAVTEAKIPFWDSEPGHATIQALIRTQEGATIKVDPIDIEVQ